MKKIDIMNMRENEDWQVVDGKAMRVYRGPVKVEGPVVHEAIKEVIVTKEPQEVTPIKKTEFKKKEAKKKWKQ